MLSITPQARHLASPYQLGYLPTVQVIHTSTSSVLGQVISAGPPQPTRQAAMMLARHMAQRMMAGHLGP
jgi:hypothetical protein